MLISLRVSDLIGFDWPNLSFKTNQHVKWNKGNTYFVIFAGHQERQLKFFKENCGGFNILFEGPPAYNEVHPNNEKGNTLIIFEVQERFFEN